MFAIIETGGKQYKVTEQDIIFVEKLDCAEGDEITFDKVVALSTEAGFKAGAPTVEGAKVEANVVKQMKTFYPDAFSTLEEANDTFLMLANIEEIMKSYLDGAFISNKETIIQHKMSEYFSDSTSELGDIVGSALEKMQLRLKELDSVELEDLHNQLKQQDELFEKLKSQFGTFINKFQNGFRSEVIHLNETISRPELAVLTSKILVMHMQPVVSRKNTFHHFVVINNIVRNFSISECHGHSIVPRQNGFWRIHRKARHFLQFHLVHINVRHGNFCKNTFSLKIRDDLKRNVTQFTLALKHIVIRDEITAAFIIKEPTYLHFAFQNPIRHAVSLQMIRLSLIHRNEDVCRIKFC